MSSMMILFTCRGNQILGRLEPSIYNVEISFYYFWITTSAVVHVLAMHCVCCICSLPKIWAYAAFTFGTMIQLSFVLELFERFVEFCYFSLGVSCEWPCRTFEPVISVLELIYNCLDVSSCSLQSLPFSVLWSKVSLNLYCLLPCLYKVKTEEGAGTVNSKPCFWDWTLLDEHPKEK